MSGRYTKGEEIDEKLWKIEKDDEVELRGLIITGETF